MNDVDAAIRKIGGVFGRQSLDGSPDFALDLRGFGTNGAQNMVVMVDGVRLNENELANAVLSTIPIDTVERIEIQRGGSSVLYGEGATGGVIQIFTRRATSQGLHGSVFAFNDNALLRARPTSRLRLQTGQQHGHPLRLRHHLQSDATRSPAARLFPAHLFQPL